MNKQHFTETQKTGYPPPFNISLNFSFIVESPLLGKLHIAHLYSRKLKEKEKFEKRNS